MRIPNLNSNRGASEILMFVLISLAVFGIAMQTILAQSRSNTQLLSQLNELEGFYMSDIGANIGRASETRIITGNSTSNPSPSPTPTVSASPTVFPSPSVTPR